MEILVALAATVPVLVVVAVLLVAVRGDGYGRRTPPPSRRDWSGWADPSDPSSLPSRPYRETGR